MADPLTIGAMLTAASGVIGAGATIAGGAQANANAKFEAKQMRARAAEERAIAGRKAMEERRRGRLALSTLQANAAASGAGATDPTVLGLMSDIAGRAEYNALAETWSGEQRARGLMDSAAAAKASGKAAQRGSYLSAAGTILSSAGSMFSQFDEDSAGGGSWMAWG